MVSSPSRLSWQRLRPLSEGASIRGQGPSTRFCLSAADLSRSGAGKSGAGGRGTARAAPIRAEGWGVRASYHAPEEGVAVHRRSGFATALLIKKGAGEGQGGRGDKGRGLYLSATARHEANHRLDPKALKGGSRKASQGHR